MNFQTVVPALASVVIAGMSIMGGGGVAGAAEIKCLCPVGMKAAIDDLVPKFERSSGHKVTLEYATAGVIVDRILKGESADVTIVTVRQNEELQKQGKLIAGSRVDVAKVGVGVFVGAGSPKPDISSVETFKRSILAAKSISYSDPAGGGISGIHMASVVERLGIAAEMKPKTKLFQNSQAALQAIVKGDAEIGFGLTSDAAATSGVDLVGPLPPEVQSFTLYAAGIIASGKQAEAAKAMISHFSTPEGQAVLKAEGFEPY
jgi:molybdate transport system substrate-binding protein